MIHQDCEGKGLGYVLKLLQKPFAYIDTSRPFITSEFGWSILKFNYMQLGS